MRLLNQRALSLTFIKASQPKAFSRKSLSNLPKQIQTPIKQMKKPRTEQTLQHVFNAFISLSRSFNTKSSETLRQYKKQRLKSKWKVQLKNDDGE
jgi:dimeric dUTPase (all-alpha-NTP-PPase superfamily)